MKDWLAWHVSPVTSTSLISKSFQTEPNTTATKHLDVRVKTSFLSPLCFFGILNRTAVPCLLQTVVHAQGALQLLDNTLVKGYLLPEVGLHHVFEVHLSPLMEVAHLCLEGEPHCPAAFPNAVGLILVHLPFITHPLALLHLGKGTWVEIKNYITLKTEVYLEGKQNTRVRWRVSSPECKIKILVPIYL